jgi:hypothetical protein
MIVGLFKPPCLPGASHTGYPGEAYQARLLYHAGRARPVILHPFALILGFLLAYAWWLVLVGIILPIFAHVVGAD